MTWRGSVTTSSSLSHTDHFGGSFVPCEEGHVVASPRPSISGTTPNRTEMELQLREEARRQLKSRKSVEGGAADYLPSDRRLSNRNFAEQMLSAPPLEGDASPNKRSSATRLRMRVAEEASNLQSRNDDKRNVYSKPPPTDDTKKTSAMAESPASPDASPRKRGIARQCTFGEEAVIVAVPETDPCRERRGSSDMTRRSITEKEETSGHVTLQEAVSCHADQDVRTLAANVEMQLERVRLHGRHRAVVAENGNQGNSITLDTQHLSAGQQEVMIARAKRKKKTGKLCGGVILEQKRRLSAIPNSSEADPEASESQPTDTAAP